jgi:hypothetical protein
MPDYRELRDLQNAVRLARKRYRSLIEEFGRLQPITGFSPEQILDSILFAFQARQTTYAALAAYVARHRCDQSHSGKRLDSCGTPKA